MVIFKINNVDFSDLVTGLKVGYETLVSDNSGRNAAGDTVIDVINTKRKIYVTLRHTTFAEMQSFLAAVEPFKVTVTYLDPKPEYYNISHTLYKPMNLNFIEL